MEGKIEKKEEKYIKGIPGGEKLLFSFRIFRIE
jgi:hypothetical protein